ncbi:hypothetical protein [Streptomyces malaysiensis]|uniref:hypothetical protein n=1 Tax=Streptomyces malaysiensis TaxID=92644 RepID=UPI0011CD83A0|nr:hypothetical protein [Streptomyces malaysiensis]
MGFFKRNSDNTSSTDSSTGNQISGGESGPVVQAGSTGAVNTGDQTHNHAHFNGDNQNVNVINGDNHGGVSFGRN